MNESKKMALLAVEALEDKKAEDITIIDISEVSVLADYFIIADGSNRNQVQAMADSAEEALGRAGYDAKQIEVETRKQQSHEQKSGRKHYEFSL